MVLLESIVEFQASVPVEGFAVETRSIAPGKWAGAAGARPRWETPCFVQVGFYSNSRRLDLGEHRVHVDLANATTPERMHHFVEKFGTLTREMHSVQPLEFMRAASQAFRLAMSEKTADRVRGMRRLARLTAGDDDFEPLAKLALSAWPYDEPQMRLKPPDLLNFCILQLTFDFARLPRFLACAECGDFLQRLKDPRQNVYCGDACKLAAWRARNPEGNAAINARRREKRAKAKKRRVRS